MPTSHVDKFKVFALVIQRQAKDRLEEFRQYTREIESKFDSDKDILTRRYNEHIAGLSTDEVNEINDYFSDDYYTIDEVYIGQYRKSTLVSIYSFLEHAMNRLCRHLMRKNGYSIAVEDLRGEGIVRARNYLEKAAGADFALLNGEWSKLTTLNKIRNCIVHSEGDITASNTASLHAVVAATPGLSLRSERLIAVDRTYIDQCATTIEEFLDKLYKQVL